MSTVTVLVANNCASQEGRYSYQSILGVGSFGTVLSAEDDKNGQVVAVKLIKAKGSFLDFFKLRSSTKIGEAKQEVDLLIQLQHPNIVGLIDYFEFSEMFKIAGLAMVMEFCEKGNLQEHLGSMAPTGKRLDLSKRKKWYTQLASAVQFIHSKGIIHRDLKPPNILLDKEENLKIADVGLARTVWEVKNHCNELPHDTTFNTYMSSLTGTPVYMAPEIWDEHYKMDSDVFSLGLIFVMIAVIPNPPIPYAYWQQTSDCLGKLLHDHLSSRDKLPSELLQLSFDTLLESEWQLFNEMLKYSYQDRICIDQIITRINEIHEPSENKKKEATEPTEPTTTGRSWCIIS